MKNYIPLVVPLYNLSEQTPRSVPSFSYTRNIYLLKKTGKLKQFARFTDILSFIQNTLKLQRQMFI